MRAPVRGSDLDLEMGFGKAGSEQLRLPKRGGSGHATVDTFAQLGNAAVSAATGGQAGCTRWGDVSASTDERRMAVFVQSRTYRSRAFVFSQRKGG